MYMGKSDSLRQCAEFYNAQGLFTLTNSIRIRRLISLKQLTYFSYRRTNSSIHGIQVNVTKVSYTSWMCFSNIYITNIFQLETHSLMQPFVASLTHSKGLLSPKAWLSVLFKHRMLNSYSLNLCFWFWLKVQYLF